MSASDKISFKKKFSKFISRDGLELRWKTADQSKQYKEQMNAPCEQSLLFSSFCFLERGEGSSPALHESRQNFEVAQPKLLDESIVFSLVKLFFFFVFELLFSDKPMVISKPAVTRAQLLGLGSKLYHNNMQHMLN